MLVELSSKSITHQHVLMLLSFAYALVFLQDFMNLTTALTFFESYTLHATENVKHHNLA